MMLNFALFLVLFVPTVTGTWLDFMTLEPPVTDPEETSGSTPGFWDSISLDLSGEVSTGPPSGGFFELVTLEAPGLQAGEFPTEGPSPVGATEKLGGFSDETGHSATAPYDARDSSVNTPSVEGKLNALLIIGALLLALTGGQLCMNLRASRVCPPSCGANERAGSTNQYPEDCTGSPTSQEEAGKMGPEAVV